jgi:protein-S-isoprenylcysteine O-methyltransferase Ste14
MHTSGSLRNLNAAFSASLRRGGKAYDLLAALPLIVWYVLSAADLLSVTHGLLQQWLAHPDVTTCLALLAKGASLLFALVIIGLLLLRKPPSNSARGLAPRVASLLGTYLIVAIVLLPGVEISAAGLALSSALILGGMAFALFSILWLGRSFSLMAEARELVVTGPYSRIRHPLYVGEELAALGAALQHLSPLGMLLLILQVCCQLYRMKCEEAVLEEAFPSYATYKVRTARLIPGIY